MKLSVKQYLQNKLDLLEYQIAEKTSNVKRLEAQRNELNSLGNDWHEIK